MNRGVTILTGIMGGWLGEAALASAFAGESGWTLVFAILGTANFMLCIANAHVDKFR